MVHRLFQNWPSNFSGRFNLTSYFPHCLQHNYRTIQSLNTCGFRSRMPNSLPEMPMNNSYIYALWDETNSEEPVGWYFAKVTYKVDDRSISLKYCKGNLIEVIKPIELKLHPASGTNKWFQPLNGITETPYEPFQTT